MAKSNSKTQVFLGRKDAMQMSTAQKIVMRASHKWHYKQPTTKSAHNVGKRTKTQRKELARVNRNLKNVGLQAKLVKEHIGAGLIFYLVSRCEPQESP